MTGGRNRRHAAQFAMLSLLLAGTVATAADLDAPIQPTRPTIRTEIYRGKEAGSACGIETEGLFECVNAVQNSNVQQNTATDAFNAGLFFNAWLISEGHFSAVKSVTGREEGATGVMRFYKSMKQYQTRLGIDNKSLCEATRVVCANVVPLMQEWDARYKAR